ncbi:MAG: 50S ribosomal protein L6 [Patescibacteria group bacterium]|nr:50S ribosomal protein L6 [Patescibacteria group bacterium]
MSRIGKKPIILPAGVEAQITADSIRIKGPKGEITRALPLHLSAEIVEGEGEKQIQIKVENPEEISQNAVWGTMRSIINSMVLGVTTGFEKKLEVVGVGYKAAVSGKVLTLDVGFSHSVPFELPAGIEATVEKNVITLKGIDKELIGQVAANVRKIRKPEPYKGKGIKYIDEVIRRKAGKAAKAAGATG